jgi:hypothetical protein
MSRLLKTAFVVLLVSTVVLMSMFPKAPGEGSYQSVEGPTTVFTAWRAVILLTLILLAAALTVGSHHGVPAQCLHTPDPSDLTCAMLC